MISLDGELLDPDAEVDDALARLWVIDVDADIDAWLLWCAGETGVETLRALLLELRERRRAARG